MVTAVSSMKRARQVALLAVLLIWTPPHVGRAAAQVISESALAQRLLSDDVNERALAIEQTKGLAPRSIGPELRGVLIAILEREGRQHLLRYEADRRGENLKPLQDPEFIARVSRVVAQLNDRKAIPALAAVAGIGASINTALADFGEQAAPAVLQVVTSSRSTHYAVDGGLIVLRFMVEEKGKRPLSTATLDNIRRAAEQRLTGKQEFVPTLWRAIDLAVALRDPGLRRIVQSLASDPNQVIARGVTDPQLVARTQKRAADGLAGVPALPRR